MTEFPTNYSLSTELFPQGIGGQDPESGEIGERHLNRNQREAALNTFVKPYSFSSPSAAAAVVLERNSNGLSEWKMKGEKRTYNDVKQARIATDGVGA